MIRSPLIKQCPIEGCHLYNSSSSSTLRKHLEIHHRWLVCPLLGCQDHFPLDFLRHHFSTKHFIMKCFVKGCSHNNISFAELATHLSNMHPYPFLLEVYHALFPHISLGVSSNSAKEPVADLHSFGIPSGGGLVSSVEYDINGFMESCNKNLVVKASQFLAQIGDVNVVSDEGWSGLTLAAHKNSLKILDWLLEQPDIDVNIKPTIHLETGTFKRNHALKKILGFLDLNLVLMNLRHARLNPFIVNKSKVCQLRVIFANSRQ